MPTRVEATFGTDEHSLMALDSFEELFGPDYRGEVAACSGALSTESD